MEVQVLAGRVMAAVKVKAGEGGMGMHGPTTMEVHVSANKPWARTPRARIVTG
jgi:hypothetical protein